MPGSVLRRMTDEERRQIVNVFIRAKQTRVKPKAEVKGKRGKKHERERGPLQMSERRSED